MNVKRTESKQINFRVSEHEYERLSIIANNHGLTVPSFCKERAKGSRMIDPKVDKDGAIKIALELRRIGNNVNQLAKCANSGENVSKDEIMAMQKELGDIWQQFNLALQKK